MNVHVVRGQDGLNRRAFSAADVRRMTETGILGEDDPFELIDGELIEMSPKGPLHDLIKNRLATALVRALDESFYVAVESTLRLGPLTLVEPDILLCREGRVQVSGEGYAEVAGSEILLVIEVANASLSYDRRRKAALYASHGVGEYWIIDVAKRRTLVHSRPEREAYPPPRIIASTGELTPIAPGLERVRIRLADLI